MHGDSTSPTKIVVVDDDLRIRDLISRVLTREGFEVLLAKDAKALDSILRQTAVDIMVLDVMMPGEDGFSICRRLRSSGDGTPIIMLTAKDQDTDCIAGLTLGADDYISKPFNILELLARVRTVLRRKPAKKPRTMAAEDQGAFQFGDFAFDLEARTLRKKGQALHLTSGDFLLLRALVLNPRVPMTRDQLSILTCGQPIMPLGSSVYLRVARLRKLIETDPNDPRLIQTVWNVGYIFMPHTV